MSSTLEERFRKPVGLRPERPDYGLDVFLHDDNELMIDLYGHIAKNLSVLGKVKVVQAVRILTWAVMLHELLFSTVLLQAVEEMAGIGEPKGQHLKVFQVFLHHLLDGADGAVHEREHHGCVVLGIRVAHAHEQQVRRQPGHHVHNHAAGLQVQDEVLDERGLVLPAVLQHAQVLLGS